MDADPEVPAPPMSRAGPGVVSLFAGMVMAPLAWALQMLIGYGLAAHACYPTDIALSAPLWPHLRAIVGTVSVLLWILLAVGFFIAWRNWQSTRAHAADWAEYSVQSGAGRSRFMATCGLWVSALFAIVQLFTSMGILWIPGCGA
ncbi:MAG: hypothetical protein ABI434_22660 [Burkholderiaceae bacterium]